MPLVDYGSSDESETESNSDGKNDLVVQDDIDKKSAPFHDQDFSTDVNVRGEISENRVYSDQCLPIESGVNQTYGHKSALFDNLPLPKNVSFREDSLKLLHKNKNQPVKIILPSLKDLKSGDNEEAKKKKPSTKGSGLFALLPAPKNVNTLVPKSIQSNLNISKKIKPVKKKQPPVPLLISTEVVPRFDEDDNDDQEAPASFFFTSNDDPEHSMTVDDEISATFEERKSDSSVSETLNLTDNNSVQLLNSVVSKTEKSFTENNSLPENYNSAGAANIDAEALEKLCGAGARKRKGELPEDIIDINVDSIVGDAYMWLSKDLTKEQEHRGFKKARNLSSVERRKHQITYLASQAKEKEMELRNQWANSRMTRKQTQSKYGF